MSKCRFEPINCNEWFYHFYVILWFYHLQSSMLYNWWEYKMKTGQLCNSLMKNFQDILKRQKTSQNSLISFFNTLSRVRAPPNPTISNNIMTALFTTWNQEKKIPFQCPMLFCVWYISHSINSTINEQLTMDCVHAIADSSRTGRLSIRKWLESYAYSDILKCPKCDDKPFLASVIFQSLSCMVSEKMTPKDTNLLIKNNKLTTKINKIPIIYNKPPLPKTKLS